MRHNCYGYTQLVAGSTNHSFMHTSSWFFLRKASSSLRPSICNSRSDLHSVNSSNIFFRAAMSDSTDWRMASSFSYLYDKKRLEWRLDSHASSTISTITFTTYFALKSSAASPALSMARQIIPLAFLAFWICNHRTKHWRFLLSHRNHRGTKCLFYLSLELSNGGKVSWVVTGSRGGLVV